MVYIAVASAAKQNLLTSFKDLSTAIEMMLPRDSATDSNIRIVISTGVQRNGEIFEANY